MSALEHATTAPGAAIGSDSDILPQTREIKESGMNAQQMGLIDSIQELARAIRRETDVPVSYKETLHRPEAGNVIDASVTVQLDTGVQTWNGSSKPLKCQIALEEMREEMGAWLVEYRKQEAAA